MIVSVTGASGHIGANLIRALLKQGRTVRVLIHNDRQALEGLEVEVVKGSITDPYSLYRTFSGSEIVYHLATIMSPSGNRDLESINVIGTRNVVEACLKCGVRRLVHFSSIHALVQTPMDIPVDELRPLVDSHGSPVYGRSMAASEIEVRQGIEDGLDAIIINPTAVIGPLDFKPSLTGRGLLALARGKLPALIEGGFDWVDVRDVVVAALVAEEVAPLGARYILSGRYASLADIARLTEEIVGTSAPQIVAPAWLARTGATAISPFNYFLRGRHPFAGLAFHLLSSCNRNISHERASRELNFFPRSLRSTLKDTFQWFQERGLLELSKPVKK